MFTNVVTLTLWSQKKKKKTTTTTIGCTSRYKPLCNKRDQLL